MKVKKNPIRYNRRGWWPDFWTVAKSGKVGWQVKNGRTGAVISPPFEDESDAVAWADMNSKDFQ